MPQLWEVLQSMKVNTQLLSQVRTAEFDKEIHERIRKFAISDKKALNEQQEKLAKKDKEIAQLQTRFNSLILKKELAKKGGVNR